MFDRLLGLETEYALRFVPAHRQSRPTNGQIYDALALVVSTLVRTRPGRKTKRELFLANGGILNYESQHADDDGLVETGTPECRGPSEVLLYQRAQEQVLMRALPEAARRLGGGELALLKNCRDAAGHTYGAQENYEAEIAAGGWLVAWRAGLAALVPALAIAGLATWAVMIVMAPVIIATMIVVGLISLIPRMDWLRDSLEPNSRAMRAFQRPLHWIEQAIWWLPMMAFLLLYRVCAFRAVRRGLLPFLISRPIVTGAGTLVDDRFALSEKGVAVKQVCRRSLARALAIFDPGNLCKAVHATAFFDFARFGSLFRRRQRLQIGFSDSNMAQTAEYLKVATTCMVIDLIEARALTAPRIRRPLRVLRQILDGDHAAALALQRVYVAQARQFTRDAPATPLEAIEVLSRWSATLDAIESAPETLVAQIDWITKRELIERAGSTRAQRKKIDLKYHELGTGYFAEIEARHLAAILVTAEEARIATEQPPSTAPARARARLIHSLADVAKVTVGWDRVRIGGPIRGKVIRLADHRPEE